MTDRYVYYFVSSREPAGTSILSKRRGTLDAIKGKGEASMESQIVVDHSEVDDNGFMIDCTANASHSTDPRWSQIRSLELRADSRDSNALELDEDSHGADKYMLQLESRELRQQAARLKEQLTGPRTDDREDGEGLQDRATFERKSQTG